MRFQPFCHPVGELYRYTKTLKLALFSHCHLTVMAESQKWPQPAPFQGLFLPVELQWLDVLNRNTHQNKKKHL